MTHFAMTRSLTMSSALVSLTLFAACSSDGSQTNEAGGASTIGGASGTGGATGTGNSANQGGTAGTSNTSTDPCSTGLCTPSGFPFVISARAISDACGLDCPILAADTPVGETTATMSQPEVGKLCLSGTVSPGGWAQIGLFFVERSPDRTQILKTFDAKALGITQVAFTLDSPPRGGLAVTAAVTIATSCPGDFNGCLVRGFDVMTAPGSSVRANYTTQGQFIVPFANFTQTVGTQNFDTSNLYDLFFVAGDGAYDFCIRDFKFLDAQGNEVKASQ